GATPRGAPWAAGPPASARPGPRRSGGPQDKDRTGRPPDDEPPRAAPGPPPPLGAGAARDDARATEADPRPHEMVGRLRPVRGHVRDRVLRVASVGPGGRRLVAPAEAQDRKSVVEGRGGG